MITALVVASVGGLGAACRMAVDDAVGRHLAKSGGRRVSPTAGTFTVNVVGSLLLGLVVGAVVFHGATSTWRTLVGTGFCGGFTTWSTFVWEGSSMARADRRASASYVVVGLAGPVLAGGAGLVLAYAA